MKDETIIWIGYSEENLKSAKVLLKSHLYNPCLQNVQQCVEKSLKAILIEKSIKLQRTHDILELRKLLIAENIEINIDENECDFFRLNLSTIKISGWERIGRL